MTKSKSSASSIVVSSVFLVHLVNGAQFLNTACVYGSAMTVTSPVIKMQALL